MQKQLRNPRKLCPVGAALVFVCRRIVISPFALFLFLQLGNICIGELEDFVHCAATTAIKP